jgi:hypothetical protein
MYLNVPNKEKYENDIMFELISAFKIENSEKLKKR